jgi:type IV pilus assembly protein PilV
MHLSPDRVAVRRTNRRGQYGLSLIESLVALVVLALGIMGLAGVQTRLLVESRTANHRATAIGLIDDLTNRMYLNRDAAIANSYALTWDATKAVQDCRTAICSGAQLAQSDLNAWRLALIAALPSGNASVFQSANDPRQIGIAIAWSANESKAADVDNATFYKPLAVTATANGVDCPASAICHIVYVQP